MKKFSMLKKVYRIGAKFLLFSIFYFISPFLKIFKLDLVPDLSKINFFNFNYSTNTRRLVFNTKNKKSFNKVFIDTSLSTTKLCELGKKFPTVKSPIQLTGHRAGYTGVYSLLFSSLIDKTITLAEIGILDNNSIKMWRNYFKKAKIYGFEFDEKRIKKAKKHKLNKTYIRKINVHNEKDITESFKKTKTRFDIIIDDSTHIFEDQITLVLMSGQTFLRIALRSIQTSRHGRLSSHNIRCKFTYYGNEFVGSIMVDTHQYIASRRE